MLLFSNFAIGNNWLNLYQPETNYGVSDTFSKTMGNHSLSFGGEFKYYQLNVRNECGPNGYFQFSGNETNSDVSDFYIGAPGAFVQCSVQLLDNRTRYGGMFVADTWKVKPKLTVNLGLRWDIARPWSDIYGRLTTPVPGVQSAKFPNSPAGNLVPGDPGVPSTISPTQYSNFGPRIGIAYAPYGGIWGDNKTSIRAASGSTIWVPPTTATSASSVTLPGVFTGLRRNRPSLPVPTSPAQTGCRRDSTSPLPSPAATGRSPTSSSDHSCLSTFPVTTTRTRRKWPSTITFPFSGNSTPPPS